MHLQQVAEDAAAWFETATRPSGETFTRNKDGAPEWVRDLVREAHGTMLPDDWRYSTISAAIDWLAEGNDPEDDGDFADGVVDTYSSERLDWLGSNLNRAGYVDEATAELGGARMSDGEYGRGGGEPLGVFDLIGQGQYLEALEVFASVRDSLADVAETLSEAETT